jgi:hypothetical protein
MATSTAPRSSFVDRVFRNPKTGELAIAQVPNVPLAIFLVTAVVRWTLHPTGTVGTVVTVIGAAGLLWWAVGEIGWGDSLFRRFLGAAVLIGTVGMWVFR